MIAYVLKSDAADLIAVVIYKVVVCDQCVVIPELAGIEQLVLPGGDIPVVIGEEIKGGIVMSAHSAGCIPAAQVAQSDLLKAGVGAYGHLAIDGCIRAFPLYLEK